MHTKTATVPPAPSGYAHELLQLGLGKVPGIKTFLCNLKTRGGFYWDFNIIVNYAENLQKQQNTAAIGGFNQRQGEALPPQIFLTLSRFVFTVQRRKWGQFILKKIIEIVAT